MGKEKIYNPYTEKYLVGYRYRNVERIKIDCKIVLLDIDKVLTWEYTDESEADFKIRCPNNECTAKYINLESQISNMVAHNETQKTFTVECLGWEATDHEEERCATKCECEVSISYRR